MASSSDSYQTFASFGVVSGVVVKISDKFQPPRKITLPPGLKDVDPSELLCFQYDFTKEKEALAQAEEESLIRLRQVQRKEEEERIQKEKEEEERLRQEEEEKLRKEAEQERLRQEETERLQKEEEQAKLRQLEDEARLKQQQEETTKTQQEHRTSLNHVSVVHNTQQPVSSSVDILTPLVVTNTSVHKQQHQNHMFDPLEFENQNDNPFELVERATLNEFDELRSVLDPEVTQPTRKVTKAAADNSKPDEFELSSVFFNPPPVVAQTQDENTEEIITITDTVPSVSQDQVYTNEGFSLIPHQPSKGTLTWTQFDSSKQQQIINPFNPMNPFSTNFQTVDMVDSDRNTSSLLSKTPPPSVGRMDLYDNGQYHGDSNGYETSNNFVNPTPLPRTKSLPNLQDANDYENCENISILKQDGSPNYNGVRFTNSQENSPMSSQSQKPVPTDRIENIMKQFQFQRMGPQSTPPSQQVNHSLGNNMNNMGLGSPEEGNATVPNTNYPSSSIANQYGTPIASSGSYVPPYMAPSSNPNQMYMNYSHPQQPIAAPVYSTPQSDYSSGGPMMIHSRPLSMNSNMAVGPPPDSVINLNPSTGSDGQINYPVRSLPPISSSNTNSNRIYSVPNFGTPQPDNIVQPPPYPQPPMQTTTQPTERRLPPRRPESAKLPDIDLKSSPSIPLPNIGTNPSFLQDMYPSLSTSEKNFANQLNAMGFPLPCVSRTIKRLGMDEKEVLDFLVLVEELKDTTKKEGDDIEMALLNNNCDKVKATTYLEMVATFQELGFQRMKIHDALKETDCDQHNALDYLTR